MWYFIQHILKPYKIEFAGWLWGGGRGYTVIGILSYYNLVANFLLEDGSIFCVIDIDLAAVVAFSQKHL